MLDGMLGGYPRNMLAAKFNVPYAVAAALVTGRTDITVFRPEVIAQRSVRDVFDRVSVRVGNAMRQQAATSPGASVEISIPGRRRADRSRHVDQREITAAASHAPTSLTSSAYLVEPVLGASRSNSTRT